jgi:glycosyltransferase involved in cell wall biosynthesis
MGGQQCPPFLLLPMILALICTTIWLAFLLRAAYHGSAIEELRKQRVVAEDKLPTLSLVIAASNERHTMQHSIPDLLATDYPNVEFILVDDRSSDGTGELIEGFAKNDDRVHPIHIILLPEGWLGKVNALDTGASTAKGKWLLFTDADIHFRPHALEKAVAFAEQQRLDHLMLVPEPRQTGSTLLDLFVLCFGSFFVQTIKAREIGNPKSKAYGGVGAFNLVRRTSLEKTEGFEWLKMDVIDDVGLGLLLRRHHAKARILSGTDLIHFEWYPSLREMIKGLEKNTFAGFARYSYPRAGLLTIAMLLVILYPLIWSIIIGSVVALAATLFIYIFLPFLVALTQRKLIPTSPRLMLMLPLGFLLLTYALVRSTYITWREKGIRWRGTFYPLDALRRGQRVKL